MIIYKIWMISDILYISNFIYILRCPESEWVPPVIIQIYGLSFGLQAMHFRVPPLTSETVTWKTPVTTDSEDERAPFAGPNRWSQGKWTSITAIKNSLNTCESMWTSDFTRIPKWHLLYHTVPYCAILYLNWQLSGNVLATPFETLDPPPLHL